MIIKAILLILGCAFCGLGTWIAAYIVRPLDGWALVMGTLGGVMLWLIGFVLTMWGLGR